MSEPTKKTIEISDEDRDCVTLALVKLAQARPGWRESCLRRIAVEVLDAGETFDALSALDAASAALEAARILRAPGFPERADCPVCHCEAVTSGVGPLVVHALIGGAFLHGMIEGMSYVENEGVSPLCTHHRDELAIMEDARGVTIAARLASARTASHGGGA